MPKDDLSELFVWVDDQDTVLGSITRDEAHTDKSKIHRAILVLVSNSEKALLFQKRTEHKDLYPGFWGLSCGGHVSPGESYRLAAVRELQEELGVNLYLQPIEKILFQKESESEFIQVYKAETEEIPQNFDVDEISEMRWVERNDLVDFIEREKVTPTGIETLKKLGMI